MWHYLYDNTMKHQEALALGVPDLLLSHLPTTLYSNAGTKYYTSLVPERVESNPLKPFKGSPFLYEIYV